MDNNKKEEKVEIRGDAERTGGERREQEMSRENRRVEKR